MARPQPEVLKCRLLLSNRRSPTYIDLFAGCGGLSLGLDKAGFELAFAVEKSTMATETSYHNLIARIENLRGALR